VPARANVDGAAQREQVERMLVPLSPVEREVLLRFHQREESVAEIARALALPEGTVKSHLSRARHKLARRREDA
jgi:RNA polymerase sigma-70 factor (ECF subfamily)